jgi:hypothetical protein
MNGSKPSEKNPPPYVSYKTFRNYLDTLRQDGIPGRLDASVMKNLSGQTQSQLRGALRFLNLITDDNVPQEALEQLVLAEGSERQQALQEIIKAGYAFILGDGATIDITKATPQQFSTAFKDAGLSGDTIRKGEAFFLQAVTEAGIAISRHIKAGRPSAEQSRSPRPRNGSPSKRRIKEDSTNTPKNGVPPPSTAKEPKEPRLSLRETLLQTLVKKFPDFNPEWGDEAQSKWLDAFDRLADRIAAIEDVDEDEEYDA